MVQRVVDPAAVAALVAVALGSCAIDPAVFGPTIRGPSVIGEPPNAIDRALAFCGEKTERAEEACVRKALVDGNLGPSAIAAMIPGCKVGMRCNETYRTRDRSGILAATASDYVADWVVTFDLADARATPATVPLAVQQI